MSQQATFQEADEVLAAQFALLSSVSVRGGVEKRLYEVSDRVAVHLEAQRDWTRIAVVYESRPGVWHHLGDLVGTPEYDEVRAALRLVESGRRTDIHGDRLIPGFARIVAANARLAAKVAA